jgi:hypothetical protein
LPTRLAMRLGVTERSRNRCWGAQMNDVTAGEPPTTLTVVEEPRQGNRSRWVRLLATAPAVLVTLLALAVGPASAALTRAYTGAAFGPSGTSGGVFSEVQAIAADPTTGDVYVYDAEEGGKVYKFSSSGEPVAFSGLGGSNAIEGVGVAGAGENQIAVAPAGSPANTEGDIYIAHSPGPVRIYSPAGLELGAIGEGETCGVAVDPAGHIYVGTFPNIISEYVPTTNPPSNADLEATGNAEVELCSLAVDGAGRVYASNYQGQRIARLEGIGSPSPALIEPGASSIAADPVNDILLADRHELVAEYDASGTVIATFGGGQLTDSTAVAISSRTAAAYVFDGQSGKVKVFGPPVILPEATTREASNIGPTTATLEGSVNPEGIPLEACLFEYGLTAAYGTTAACVTPSAAEVGSGTDSVPVHVNVFGLSPNTQYHFRYVARNEGGLVRGADETLSTVGPPLITEVRARDADQESAIIEAKIDPRGFDTTYRFEWGPTTNYGHIASASSIASADPPTRVSTHLSGLAVGATYRYRVVAENGEGRRTISPDQTVETLDSCSLPAGRCFELVSPPEVGVVSSPGNFTAVGTLHYQAAVSGPGGLAYTVENGLPGSTSGADVLYQGLRGAGGWNSAQLNPAIKERNQTTAGNSTPSVTLDLSEDLSCEIVATPQLLTKDTGTKLVVEGGGANLYRRSSNGSYAAISYLPPENPEVRRDERTLSTEYGIVGTSSGCSKVVFSSEYDYPGTGGTGVKRLYEWTEGVLRNVGWVPEASGEEVAVEAVAGGPGAVSEDGSRVFFSSGGALYVRENARTTRKLAEGGATFQSATPDGSKVFFSASAGLTNLSSPSGTDLYEYDLETNTLTDRSAAGGSEGAEVAGLIGASADGSIVYFAASGELDPGKGRSLSENRGAGTYSIYASSGGYITYIGAIRSEDVSHVTVADRVDSTSWVSSDGQYLLFESSGNVTGYQSGGVPEAYLFDAAGAIGREATVCISCRQDGEPSVGSIRDLPLASAAGVSSFYGLNRPRSLVDWKGEARVYFYSRDKLAPDSGDGVRYLYEWANGQVFRLAAEPPVVAEHPVLAFAGASIDGSNVYLSTPETLTWEDRDERSSVYDARVGGGFQQPPGSPPPCDPSQEGSCEVSSSAPLGAPPVASATFSGPANPRRAKCKRGSRPKRGRCVRKNSKHRHVKRSTDVKKSDGKHKRHANSDRRVGK